MHCDEDTAQKRLLSFIKLIESWDKCGCLNEQRPAIAQNYEIIDGVHRVALARYHEMKTISCDVYTEERVKEYRNNLVDLDKRIINRVELTEVENKLLKDIQIRLGNTI